MMTLSDDEVRAGRQGASAMVLTALVVVGSMASSEADMGLGCPKVEGVVEFAGSQFMVCTEEVVRGLSRLCSLQSVGGGRHLSFSPRTGGCLLLARPLGGSTALHLGFGLDVNRVSVTDMQLIPGIGPKGARRIVDGRPYLRLSDLLRVPGIGKRRLAKFRAWLRVTSLEGF